MMTSDTDKHNLYQQQSFGYGLVKLLRRCWYIFLATEMQKDKNVSIICNDNSFLASHICYLRKKSWCLHLLHGFHAGAKLYLPVKAYV